jgi:branched-chain amino acid aminotransferase
MANHIQSHLNKNKDILIYINGSLYKRQDAKISVYDSGFLMGDGIWEGLRLVDGNWIFLDEHIDRLFEGLKAIDINLSM